MSYRRCLVWLFSISLMCLWVTGILVWAAFNTGGYQRVVMCVMALAMAALNYFMTTSRYRELSRYK